MIVYLNGDFMPVEQAKISPMDRGFLFGDGIYELIPSHSGRFVGFNLHLDRMNNGLDAIGIVRPDISVRQWLEISQQLLERNEGTDLGIYLHITRGDEGRRYHAFPEKVTPTVFAMTTPIFPFLGEPDSETQPGLSCYTAQDKRWKRCNVKSTALLGNVLHFQDSYSRGGNECILYNADNELTEGSASNVVIVNDNQIITPPLDEQILPGITRHLMIESLRKEGGFGVSERVIHMDEVRGADEVWVTNSGVHILPVVTLDGRPVADGKVGPVWEKARACYNRHCFDLNV
ncbi:aminotransferase class IV [Aestuariirhabdus litorea]